MLRPDLIYPIPLAAKPTLLQLGVRYHLPTATRRYHFKEVWRLHLHHHAGELRLNGQRFPIGPGHANLLSPGVATAYHFPEQARYLFAHFTLPPVPNPGEQSIRAVQDLGDDFAVHRQALEEAVGYFTAQPLRAEVCLWHLLWDLAGRTRGTPTAQLHPAIRQTLQSIEARLQGPIRVADLAREVNLSHNYLTYLFRASFGKTIMRHIQEQRVQRARHLLIYSNLPIRWVAAEVGIEDLGLFNRMIRLALGLSPSQVRASGGVLEPEIPAEPPAPPETD